MTGKALAEAEALGCVREDVVSVLAELQVADYHDQIRSHHSGEPMYIFKPWLVEVVVYLKVVLRGDCVVVSFHEDQDADE